MSRDEWFSDYYIRAARGRVLVPPRSALETAKAQYVAGTIELHAFEVKVAHILERGEDPEPRGHDWQDGKGPVHAISLAQHHTNVLQRVVDRSRKHLM